MRHFFSNNIKKINYLFHKHYISFLPFVLPVCITYGTFVGATYDIQCGIKKNSFPFVANTIYYTGLGILSGLLYPITFPMFAGYYIYRLSKCLKHKFSIEKR